MHANSCFHTSWPRRWAQNIAGQTLFSYPLSGCCIGKVPIVRHCAKNMWAGCAILRQLPSHSFMLLPKQYLDRDNATMLLKLLSRNTDTVISSYT